MPLVPVARDRVGIHDGDDSAADDDRDRETHSILGKRFESGPDAGALAVARGDGARGADREPDHPGLGERKIDRFRLRVARSEARHAPALNPIVAQDDDRRARRFARGRQRQRVQDLAQRRGAVEAANAFEQAADAGHFDLAFLDARRGDGTLEIGSRLRLHRGAEARFSVGDASLGGLFGLLENLGFRDANGLFTLGRSLGEDLLNERSHGLIDTWTEYDLRTTLSCLDPGRGSLGTQAAAGVRAIVRTAAIMGSATIEVKAQIAVKRLTHQPFEPSRPTGRRSVSAYAHPANAQVGGDRSLQRRPGGAMQALAPAQPRLTDRNDYEYNGRHPLDANCPNTIYCYRILVPVLLEQVPMDPERRWRGLQWLAHTATGALVAMATAPIGSPLIASVLLQTSYAFTFTAYDPYTPDPVVFLISALILYLWLVDRAFTVAVVAALGVFAKETVALVASVPAIRGRAVE